MKQRLILASGSPRRKQLLLNMDLSFEVIKSNVMEEMDSSLPPSELVKSLSYQKAASVAKEYTNSFVIGADTIVTLDDQILGKPADEEEAFSMLKHLSGRMHSVLTGVTIIKKNDMVSFYEETEVVFWSLSDNEIRSYIKTGEPMDKAGAYGIQEKGAYLVEKVNGDYFSVVGLPIAKVVRELHKLGYKP